VTTCDICIRNKNVGRTDKCPLPSFRKGHRWRCAYKVMFPFHSVGMGVIDMINDNKWNIRAQRHVLGIFYSRLKIDMSSCCIVK